MTVPKVITPEPDHTELWRLEQLALVSQVATQVTKILDLDELLRQVVGLIYQTFEFYVVTLSILEDDVLVLKAQAGPVGTFSVDDAFVPQERVYIPVGQGIIGWVAAHGQELIVRDVFREARFRYAPEWPKTQAEVALPLKIENRLLGVLDIQVDYAEMFEEADMLVLRALAGQVSMAIEDTRLYAEAKRRGDYLSTISAVSGAIASILEVERLLEKVSDLIQQYFDYSCVQLFVVDAGRGEVAYRAGSCIVRGAAKLKKPYPLDDSRHVIPFVAQNGQTVLIDETYRAFPLTTTAIDGLTIRSELVVPLMYNEDVLGVLDVLSDQPNAFSLHDQLTLETLATNIAVALRNASLYSTERWRYRVAESLRRISGTLINDVSLGHILDTILIELKANLPADALAIWLIENDQIRLVAHQPPDSIEFMTGIDPAHDPWLTKGLTHTDGPLIRQADDPTDPIAAYLKYPLDHSAVIAPLRVQKRLVGLLTLIHRQPRKFGRETKDLATAFANQAAIAIENARLYRVVKEEAEINNALLDVAEMTQSFRELDRILAAIVQIPPLMAGVGRCALWLWTESTGRYEPKAAHGFKADNQAFFEQYPLYPEQVSTMGRIDETHAPLVIVAAAQDARLPAEIAVGLGLNTLILAPLVAHGEMLGLLLVTFTQPSAIRQEGIRLITGVAHHAAVAIASRSLYDRRAEQERLTHELKLAREIQVNLIPSRLPAPPGWTVATSWQAAQDVGGDFYDFIEVAPHRLGIVIADASGKGLPAALYMTQTRSLMRATTPGQLSPGRVLSRVNQLLTPDTHQGMFVSLFYGLLDTDSGAFSFANAGHNPPLLVEATGQSEALRRHGMVLGVQPDLTLEPDERHIQPGQGIVLYTDGVTEVTDAQGDLFGLTRLQNLLRAHWAEGPGAVIEAVCQAVAQFRAVDTPTDDFTLVVVRRE